MGEEPVIRTGTLYCVDKNGTCHPFFGFSDLNELSSHAVFRTNGIFEASGNTYQWIPDPSALSFSVQTGMSREGYFWLMLENRRSVRRAIRWYEKLRRMEVKGKCKLISRMDLAVQCARFKGNPKSEHRYSYSVASEEV